MKKHAYFLFLIILLISSCTQNQPSKVISSGEAAQNQSSKLISSGEAIDIVKETGDYKLLSNKADLMVSPMELTAEKAAAVHKAIPEFEEKEGWLVAFGSSNDGFVYQLDKKGAFLAKESLIVFQGKTQLFVINTVKGIESEIENRRVCSSDVSIHFQTISGKEQVIFYENNTLFMMIANNGVSNVDGLVLITQTNGNIEKQTIEKSLAISQTIRLNIPLKTKPDNITVQPKGCPDRGVIYSFIN